MQSLDIVHATSTLHQELSKMNCHMDGYYESKGKYNGSDLAPIGIQLQIQKPNHSSGIYDFTLALPLQIFTRIQTN